MKRFLSLFLVLAFVALPLSAGTLTITTVSAGTATISLTPAEDLMLNRALTLKNQFNGTNYPDVPTFIRDFMLVPNVLQLRSFVQTNNATLVFDPNQAAIVAPTPRCTSVGLTAGCTIGAVRDAICGGMGLSAGCRPQ